MQEVKEVEKQETRKQVAAPPCTCIAFSLPHQGNQLSLRRLKIRVETPDDLGP